MSFYEVVTSLGTMSEEFKYFKRSIDCFTVNCKGQVKKHL